MNQIMKEEDETSAASADNVKKESVIKKINNYMLL